MEGEGASQCIVIHIVVLFLFEEQAWRQLAGKGYVPQPFLRLISHVGQPAVNRLPDIAVLDSGELVLDGTWGVRERQNSDTAKRIKCVRKVETNNKH